MTLSRRPGPRAGDQLPWSREEKSWTPDQVRGDGDSGTIATPNRHPSESWDLVQPGPKLRQKIPASAGMTKYRTGKVTP